MTNREQVQLKQLTLKVQRYEWLLRTLRQVHRPTFIDKKPHTLPVNDFYKNYYEQNRPVIINNFMYDSLQLSDILLFVNTNVPVEILSNRNSNPNYEREKHKLKKTVLLSEFIAQITLVTESNNDYLVAYNENQKVFQDFLNKLPFIPYLQSNKGYMWLGPKGTITPFHYDLTNNLLLQVIGQKQVLLIPIWDIPLIKNHQHVFADIDYTKSNIIPSPPLNQPEVIEIILKAGDLLFIPVGWSHKVTSLSTSMTITYTDFKYENSFSETFPR